MRPHLSLSRLLTVVFLTSAASSPLLAQKQYKRIGLTGINEIIQGNPDAAIERFTKHLESAPDDAESQFGLAIAYAAKGTPSKGIDFALAAIEDGLPPGRFVTGPRELIEPLRRSARLREAVASAESGLVAGPMLGDMTDRAVSVWMRFGSSIKGCALRIRSRDGKFRKRIRLEPADANQDYVVKVRLEELAPGTRYIYEVLAGDRSLARDSFKTFPAQGVPGKFSVAFGGGAGFTPQYEHMWTTIEAARSDALLLLGDNVYIDTPKSPLAQKYCYYRRQARPEFRSLVAKTPVYAIWDDHDFGTNDCLGSPDTDEPPWKRPVFEVFRQQWVNPAFGGGDKQPGCWFDFSIANVHFILLDGRYYRTDPRKKSPTILGSAQKKWLLDTLRNSKGAFKVLISPVPWSKGTKPGSLDTWDGFDNEREEIFGFIEKNKIGGVFLVAADRHRSDCWVTERPGAYPLYEFMSSCLTNMHRHKNMKGSLFSYNLKNAFGRLVFNTAAKDPSVRYQIHTIDGELVHNFKLKRSQLGW